ncbi:MAG: polyphenol oxidase family protein [Bifidobacteriaceae bacterium]|jgi:YfiH family protein|nr:polyphenol oxidase family protein [Bifidobacteriaceae bacterium]
MSAEPTSHRWLPDLTPVNLGPRVLGGFTGRVTGSALTVATQAALRRYARVPVVTVKQIHGAGVIHLDAPPEASGEIGRADAIILSTPGVAGAILTADCVPLLLAADGAGQRADHRSPDRSPLVAAVHVGRRGLFAGIVPRVLAELTARGAMAGEVRAAIGPGICGACYEVPADMAAEAARITPEARTQTRRGTAGIDLAAAIQAQLAAAGVYQITVDPRCTFTDPTLFSYRREGAAAGRQAALIQMR